jgi:hypothetical protein
MSERAGNGGFPRSHAKCDAGQAGQGPIAAMEFSKPHAVNRWICPRRLAAQLAAWPAVPGRLSRLRARPHPIRPARARAGARHRAADRRWRGRSSGSWNGTTGPAGRAGRGAWLQIRLIAFLAGVAGSGRDGSEPGRSVERLRYSAPCPRRCSGASDSPASIRTGPSAHSTASASSNSASARAVKHRYNSRRNPASTSRARASSRCGSTPASSHAILNATATALVFKFCGRNPKIIMRWPCQVKIGDQPGLNEKPSGWLTTSRPSHKPSAPGDLPGSAARTAPAGSSACCPSARHSWPACQGPARAEAGGVSIAAMNWVWANSRPGSADGIRHRGPRLPRAVRGQLLGVHNVSKAAIPVLREQASGLVMQFSSTG